jgi:FkbM family methyltransferase
LVYYYYFYHRLFRGQKWAIRQVRIRGVSQPVWMRPGVSDWITMERIFLDQEFDPISGRHDEAMDRLQKSIVARGGQPLIIDCGANIGLSSIWLSQRFPDAVIVSIEPEPDNFRLLALNARNFPRIIALHAAISDKASRVTLLNNDDAPWAWRTQEADSGPVAAVTIPYVTNLDKNYVLMAVKVDIEGFEINLLRDATEWVDDLPLLIFEMHDWMLPWSGSGHSFISVLSKHKRDYLLRGEHIFSYSHNALEHLNDPAPLDGRRP